jgi:hypothetical protein
MLRIPPCPSTHKAKFSTDNDLCPAAQRLADCDNYRSANQRIQSSLPIASMTDEVKTLCQKLYPKRIHTSRRAATRSRAIPNHPKIPITPDAVKLTLSKLKPGTSYGPYNDYTDTLKSYALATPDQSNSNTSYFQTFLSMVRLVADNNNIPASVAPLLTPCRFLALHKDPDDLAKLRPIGIGTAWRRIVGSTIAAIFADDFASLLLPYGQFGVAVSGGIDFMFHLATAQFDNFITKPLQADKPPTRALLLLDIVNMFNQLSRDAARDALESEPILHSILPYFDLMYSSANYCYFSRPDGTLDYFAQEEGFPQGDPLSVVLSCLVLLQLLKPLNTLLQQRADDRCAAHDYGDDGLGSRSATTSFIDDTGSFLPYEDLTAFIEYFTKYGPPLGIHLNTTKTKIFTLPSRDDTASILSPTQRHHLRCALDLLNGPSSEQTEGIRYLGHPIGSPSYCRTFILAAARDFHRATIRLTKRLADPQTIATLFRFCTLPSLNHLLFADVLYNTPNDPGNPPSLTAWCSDLSSTLHEATTHLLKVVTNIPTDIPAFSYLLAHHTVKGGGLGLRDHSEAAVTSFLIPLLRSVRYTISGIPFRYSDQVHKLPAIYAKALSTWSTSRNPPAIIRTFNHYLPALQDLYNNKKLFKEPRSLTLKQLVMDAPLQGLSSKVYHHNLTQALLAIMPSLPSTTRNILSSLLSQTTSIPLHSLPRRFPDHRFHPDAYRLLLRRKLRLPLFDQPSPPTCRHCKKQCDPCGDHLFSCGFHKSPLHNHIRDTVYSITQLLGPLSGLVRSKHDVQLEPACRLPNHPTKRPLDVSVDLKTPTSSAACTVGIDVTIPPVLSHLPSRSTSSTHHIERTHLDSIRSKLNGRTSKTAEGAQIISAINEQRIALIPFTVDHFGALGRFAQDFLFSPATSPLNTPPAINLDLRRFAHDPARLAYSSALASPLHLVHHANLAWKALQTNTTRRFGCTHHTHTPQQWALQSLSLNISHALAAHLATALTSNARRAAPSQPQTTYGTTPYFPTGRRVLVPGAPRTVPTYHSRTT